MEGPGKSGPAGSSACSAEPDSQPPVIHSRPTADFRAEGFTCPHSRTRPAPLTDFNWPRPLPPTADHPRQEDHVTRPSVSTPGCQTREPSALPTELSGRASSMAIPQMALVIFPFSLGMLVRYLCRPPRRTIRTSVPSSACRLWTAPVAPCEPCAGTVASAPQCGQIHFQLGGAM